MNLTERLRGALPRQRVDADALVARIDGLRRFVAAAEGHVPEPELATARTVIGRAGERLALSRQHTVVAIAGATGSGKSSLFNALAQLNLSRVGVRRPTTGVAHACVWGTEGATPLLDWLKVPPNRRFARESALDGEDEAGLRGLVLLDLPDFDSVVDTHRLEVERLLGLVDLVVWVMDPQKYADNVVHEQYLTQFQGHKDITVVLLNQADRLNRADTERCVADLRRLLEADGLSGVPVIATSVKAAPGLGELRALLEKTVTARQAALQRLSNDVTGVVGDLEPLVTVDADERRLDKNAIRRLSDALAHAAGVPAVAEATERAYRHRSAAMLGWPVVRWLKRLKPDPLRRLHLDQQTRQAVQHAIESAPIPVSSLPEATATQQAAVSLAARSVADRAGDGLPEPWPDAVLAASRSRLADVPDALDRAVSTTDLGLSRTPIWWRVVGFLQWLGALTALAGLVWLAVRYVFFFLALPSLPDPKVGALPLPTAMLFGGLLFGLLLGVVVRPIVSYAGALARHRADTRLRAAVGEVATELIVTPIRGVLRSYAQARDALRHAGR
jgi:GTP-binding protein EngB required for normal cell division